MANRLRGEIAFQAQGDQFALRFSVNAICNLEGLLNKSFLEITDEMATWSPPADPATGKPIDETPDQVVERMKRIRATTVRAVFWASLLGGRPDMTIDGAGDLMAEIGGVLGVLNLIAQSLNAAMPAAKAAAANPPTPIQTQPAPTVDGPGTGSA